MRFDSKKWLVLGAVAVVAVGGFGVWAYTTSSSQVIVQTAEAPIDEEAVVADWAASGEHVHEAEPASGSVIEGAMSTPQNTPPAVVAVDSIVVDGDAPTQPRSIGAVDAPVVIRDYSSLTCPHCAKAHAEIMPRIIEDYVKTGKVRVIFADFPLNQPALDGSKIARCMPNDQYYNFISMLFGGIEAWAYGNNSEALINNAVLAGLSPEKARECLNDEEVEKAIMSGVQEAVQNHKVSSTPTFIINDGAEVIRGAQPYTVFQRAIEAEIEKKRQK